MLFLVFLNYKKEKNNSKKSFICLKCCEYQ